MRVHTEVASDDANIKTRRETLAQRVLQEFGSGLPDLSLLAFFDDKDWFGFKSRGKENRGLYAPIKNDTFKEPWPPRLERMVLVDDPLTLAQKPAFDHVIYLHGSTCNDEVGLVMSFSHELQHFVQYGFHRRLWAENLLLPRLPAEVFDIDTGISWPDIPTEREARIVAKTIAENLCGSLAVSKYIDRRISENLTVRDVKDWRVIRELDSSSPYDLAQETRNIFRQLRSYKEDLEKALYCMRQDPDFEHLDLSPYFQEA